MYIWKAESVNGICHQLLISLAYSVEVVIGGSFVVRQGSHVTSLLVPVPVVVVRHDVDDVQVLREDGHIVASVDDQLAG